MITQTKNNDRKKSNENASWQKVLVELYKSHNQLKRSPFLCIILLVVSTLQRASLLLNEKFQSRIIASDKFTGKLTGTILDIIHAFRYNTPQNSYDPQTILLYSFIGLNSLFLINLIFLSILEFFRIKQVLLVGYIKKYISLINCCILKIYNYLILQPSFYFCLDNSYLSTHSIESWINIILTLTVATISSQFDFSIDFEIRDSLNRRPSMWILAGVIRDVTLSLASYTGIIYIMILFSFLSSLSCLIEIIIDEPYSCPKIKETFISSAFALFSLSLSSLLYTSTTPLAEWLLSSLICLPLTYKLAHYFYKLFAATILDENFTRILDSNSFDELHPAQLELFIRFFHGNHHFYEDYLTSKEEKGVLSEALALSHLNVCTDPECFCVSFKRHQEKDQFNKEECLGENYRKKYMNKFLVNLYETYNSKRKENVAERIFFIQFLLQDCKVPTKCFSEILGIYQKIEGYGWKERALIEDLKYRIELFFENSLRKQETGSQRVSPLISLSFDDMLLESENLLRTALPVYRSFLKQISADTIELIKLEKTGIEFLSLRSEIEGKLRGCYTLNPDSKTLTTLTYAFIEHLDFRERRIKEYKRISFYLRKSQAEIHAQASLFSESSSVIFCSLLKPIGNITKITNNFAGHFGFIPQELLNRQIDIILPTDVARHHHFCMKTFIETGTSRITDQSDLLLFLVNKQKFLVPVQMNFKLEYLQLTREMGMVAFIKKTDEDRDYITFHNSGKISEITPHIYNYLFQEKIVIPHEKVHYLDIYRLIPELGINQFLFESKADIINKMHILLPKKNLYTKIGFSMKKYSSDMRMSLKKYVEDLDSTSHIIIEANIELKVIRISGQQAQFNYLVISNPKKINSQQEREAILNALFERADLLKITQNAPINRNSIIQSRISIDGSPTRGATQYFRNESSFDEKNLKLDDIQKTIDDPDEDEDEVDSYYKNEDTEGLYEREIRKSKLSKEKSDIEKETGQQSIFSQGQQKVPFDNSNSKITDIVDQQKVTFPLSSIYNSQEYEKDELIENSPDNSPNSYEYKGNSRMETSSPKDDLLGGKDLLDSYSQIQTDRQQLCMQQSSPVLVSNALQTTENPLEEGYLNKLLLEAKQYEEFKCLEDLNKQNLIHDQPGQLEQYQQVMLDNYVKLPEAKKIGERQDLHINLKQSSKILEGQNSQTPDGDNQREKSTSEHSFIQNQIEKQKTLKKIQKKKKQLKERNLSELQTTSRFNKEKSENPGLNIVSSINSTRTANFQRKNEIIKQICIKGQDRFLTMISFLGVISLFILISVSSILYQESLSLFHQESSTFKDIPYAVSIRADYSLIIKNKELEILLQDDVFGFASNPLLNSSVQDMQNSLSADNLDKLGHYQQMVMQYYRDTKLSGMKAYILNTTAVVLKNYRENGKYINQTMSLTYAFLAIQQALQEYMNFGVDRSVPYNIVQQNFIMMFAQYANIQAAVIAEAGSLFDSINSLLWLSLFVIISISFVLVGIIFPLYAKIQVKREEILKLNATFDPQKIEPLLQSLDQSLEKFNLNENVRNDKRESPRRFSAKNALSNSAANVAAKGSRGKKKKTLSQTTTLPRWSPGLIFSGILVCFLLSIYPIINLLLIEKFILEGNYNIQEIGSLYSARAQLTSNYAANYMAMSGCLYPGKLDATKYKRVHSLASTNQAKLADVRNILNNFRTDRHNQNLYSGFFLKIISGNICDAFENYPEYMQGSNILSIPSCRNVSDKIMQSGLQLSLKYAFTKFEEVLYAFDRTSVPQFIGYMRDWVSNFDFFEFNELYFNLIKVIESLRYFMITVTADYFSYIIWISSFLYIYCLVSLFLVFYFGWLYFFSSIQKALIQTRSILTVIQVSSLMDNPYVMSYLSTESKREAKSGII